MHRRVVLLLGFLLFGDILVVAAQEPAFHPDAEVASSEGKGTTTAGTALSSIEPLRPGSGLDSVAAVPSLSSDATGRSRWVLPAIGGVVGVTIGLVDLLGSDAEFMDPVGFLVQPLLLGVIGGLIGWTVDALLRSGTEHEPGASEWQPPKPGVRCGSTMAPGPS